MLLRSLLAAVLAHGLTFSCVPGLAESETGRPLNGVDSAAVQISYKTPTEKESKKARNTSPKKAPKKKSPKKPAKKKPAPKNPTPGKTRVALICVAGGESARDVLALSEAMLSTESGVALVERNEIDRCLLELEMSLNTMVDSRHAVRIGQLASVQVFAMLELAPENRRPLALLVFDTRTGLRLADQRLPKGDAEKQAEAIARIVRAAVKKRAAVGKDVKTICLKAVRNDDLPMGYNGFCAGMHHLLENRLTNVEGLAVLERRRLERITREKAVTGNNDLSDLLASVLMLHVDLQKGSTPKQIRAVAALTTADGRELARISVEGPIRKIWTLAGQVITKLAPKLSVAVPNVEVDRREEAKRFVHQAKAMYVANRHVEALASIEAAYALWPDDLEVLETAAKLHAFYARVLIYRQGFNPAPKIRTTPRLVRSSLSLLSRALDYRRKLYEYRLRAGESLVTEQQKMVHAFSGSFMADANDESEIEIVLAFENLSAIVEGHTPQTLQDFKRLQGRYRDLEINLIHPAMRRTVKDRPSFIHYTNYLRVLLNNVDLFSNTSEAWTTDTVDLLEGWLPLAEKYGVYHNSFCNINMMIVAPMDRVAQLDRVVGEGLWKMTPQDERRLNPLFEKMMRHKEPAIRVLGKLGMISRLFNDDKRPPDQVTAEAFLELGQYAEKELDQPTRYPNDSRAIIYYALLDGVEFLDTIQEKWEAVMAVHDLMMRRKELTYGVAMKATEPHYLTRSHYDPFRFRLPNLGMHMFVGEKHFPTLIESAELGLKLSEDPEVKVLDNALGRTRYRLFYLRDVMRRARPDLAKPTPVPWKKSTKLFHVADHPGLRAVSTPVLRGGYLYAVCIGQTPKWPQGYLQLLRIRIDDGETKLYPPIGKGYLPDSRGRRIQYASNHIPAVGTRYAYIPTMTNGICRVDLKSKGDPKQEPGRKDPPGVRWFDMHHGLPSNYVAALTLVNGKIYAKLGSSSGFLVSFDVGTKKVETIVSSRRSIKKTPLDNADNTTTFLHGIYSDPARRGVYFVVIRPLDQMGLWRLDTTSNTLSRVVPMDQEPCWFAQEADGNLLFAVKSSDMLEWSLVRFDVKTSKTSVLYSSTPTPCFSSPAVDPSTLIVPKVLAQPPYAQVGDWLWTSEPFGRVSLDGKTQEVYPSIEPHSLHLGDYLMRAYNFHWRSLDLIDRNRRVLYGNQTSLWLLDLK
ncbi:MAG: hypothetical protein JW818_06995 [Pirellulales bacterium]|nr:hypothetical protein [Pirellulales bacterium]